MDAKDYYQLFSSLVVLIGATWYLKGQLEDMRSTLKVLLERFTNVEKLEKRVDRLEKKVFDLQD